MIYHNSIDDNQTIVDSMAIQSVKWPLIDHSFALKRSTSAESVLMAESYQLVGSSAAHTFCLRTDRCTQTPEEWDESDIRRNESQLKEHKTESVQIKANDHQKRSDPRLVSNKDQSTQINVCDSQTTQVLDSSGVSPTKCTTKSGPIAIPTKLCVETSRSANSVEELNQEIESLVLKGMRGFSDKQTCDKIPEGHRAPVIELLCPQRAVRQLNCVGSSGEDSSDWSQSESPIFSTESNEMHNCSNCSSPKINKFLTREPPDGCEKIKIVNEDDRNNSVNFYPSVIRPVQPSSGFVLLPSRSSAFLPIFKTNEFNEFSAEYLQNRINFRKS